ncbi:MAG TPA: acyl carrier protein [Actinophytocola sp.]|uniref:acyl carrier protein n=1 Tax=Actinophytocola sp. TaxID=1872138 RepID=UPI002DB828F1|nr:acyl carrier protein [Actinophytocola sp.]HEU5471323.1 acyl carrier protein [Actinophytocola sp.]
MTAIRHHRDEISRAVKRIVALESRLSIPPNEIAEAEPLNGDLLRVNSLGFLGMLVRLEDELDVMLPDNLFVNRIFTTVADLVDVIAEAVGAQR